MQGGFAQDVLPTTITLEVEPILTAHCGANPASGVSAVAKDGAAVTREKAKTKVATKRLIRILPTRISSSSTARVTK